MHVVEIKLDLFRRMLGAACVVDCEGSAIEFNVLFRVSEISEDTMMNVTYPLRLSFRPSSPPTDRLQRSTDWRT